MTTTIGCSIEKRREFNVLRSQHSLETKQNYTQPEFFALLLERWKGLK